LLPNNTTISWLIDKTLPAIEGPQLDTEPHRAGNFLEVAYKKGRWPVTADPHMLQPKPTSDSCPPLVILSEGNVTPEALARNLLHFEFCLSKSNNPNPQEGDRFLVKLDRAIFQLLPSGDVRELETWMNPSVRQVRPSVLTA